VTEGAVPRNRLSGWVGAVSGGWSLLSVIDRCPVRFPFIQPFFSLDESAA